MTPPSSLQRTTHDYLEMAQPDHPVTAYLRRATVLLVCLNTLALLSSYLDVFFVAGTGVFASRQLEDPASTLRATQSLVYWLVETVSTAFFAVEYVLRLWSAPASPRYRGRLRFALQRLLLIDLAAVLPLFVALFAPGRAATLTVLRIGWLVRHLKPVRYALARPVVPASSDAVLQDAERELARVRQAVATCRESDLARVSNAIEVVGRHGSAVAARQGDDKRQGLQAAAVSEQEDRAGSLALLPLFDQLADDLTDPIEMATIATRLSEAHAATAAVFDAAPDWATVQVIVDGAERQGEKRVPLRRIGRRSFAALAARAADMAGAKRILYVGEVRRELARLRADLAAGRDQGGTQATDVDLTRAVSRMRDVDVPVRLAWDNLVFQLEEEHRARMQRVRADIARYGTLVPPPFGIPRWIADHTQPVRRVAQDLVARAWAAPRRYYREGALAVSRTVVPTLQRLGILRVPISELLRALDEARLESVLSRPIPAAYLEQFAFAGVQDETALVELDVELAQINGAVGRWRLRQESSFVIYGHLGTGKTALLRQARQRLLAHDPVSCDALPRKLATPAALVEYLGHLLNVPGADSVEALADHLLSSEPRVVLLDDCQHLFLRRVGGLDAVRRFFWLVAKTNHHVLWGLCIDECGYDFLSHTLPLSDLLHVRIALQARRGEDLRRLIMMRHKRSGVSLHYEEGGKRYAKAVRRRLKALRTQRPGQATLQEALELTFFDELASVCAGNITVALFYWLRSLEVRNAERFAVRPFEALNLGLVWQFSSTQAFSLVAMLQHGSLTAGDLAAIMNADPIGTRLELEILGNHNITTTEPGSDSFAVNPIVLKTVCDMLRARQLLY
ncbi:MAG: AAA family ATPase [Acidobacteriota bacterium]